MSQPISRRGVLMAGAGAAAGVVVPGVAAHAGTANSAEAGHAVGFVLNAVTLDGGEQVVALTLDTCHLGSIDPAGLSGKTFSVHVKATNPIPGAVGGEYDVDRKVTKARLDQRGRIVLELAYGEGKVGGATLGYIANRGRNVRLNLAYTITQNTPIALRTAARSPWHAWCRADSPALRWTRSAIGFLTPE